MPEVQFLKEQLTSCLQWNKARIDFLAKFIISIIKVRTVNLVEIASSFSGFATIDSHYKRLQRFFRFFEICYTEFALLIVTLLDVATPWIIAVDRTQWKLGKTSINILTLAIVVDGLAIPLFFTLLSNKGGCSNTTERIALMEKFLTVFDVSSILYVTADREFIGKDWIQWLKEHHIKPCIRIRNNTLIPNSKGKLVAAHRLFQWLPLHTPLFIKKPRRVWGISLFVSGMKLPNGEFLILITDTYSPDSVVDYARRWKIETLFGCLKSRGFRLEQTHMTDPQRLNKLLALLTIVLCWSYLTGQWRNERKPLKVKKHGRLAKSVFRYGFDLLRNVLENIEFKMNDFQLLVKILSCT